MCQCRIKTDRTVVCDSCATQVMMKLLGLPLEQSVNQQTEATIVFTPMEHDGMMSRVNCWLDELEVAGR